MGSAGKILPLNSNNAPTPGILTKNNPLEPDAVLPVGANGRSDGEPGDAVSAIGGNGRSDGERGGVLQHVAGQGGVQQHVVVRGGVLQHAGVGSDGTEYFSSEKEYNFYSDK